MKTDRIEPAPITWLDGDWCETKLEAELKASIQAAQDDHLPRDLSSARPVPIRRTNATTDRGQTELSKLVAGCGVAAIDGYVATRDYASSKGIHLAELKANGVDLQDLISTLVIHMREIERSSRRAA